MQRKLLLKDVIPGNILKRRRVPIRRWRLPRQPVLNEESCAQRFYSPRKNREQVFAILLLIDIERCDVHRPRADIHKRMQAFLTTWGPHISNKLNGKLGKWRDVLGVQQPIPNRCRQYHKIGLRPAGTVLDPLKRYRPRKYAYRPGHPRDGTIDIYKFPIVIAVRRKADVYQPDDLPVLVGVLLGVQEPSSYEAKHEDKEGGAMHAALDTKIALDEAHLKIIDAPMRAFHKAEQTLLLARDNGQSGGEQVWIVLVRERSEGYGVADALLTDDYFGERGSKVDADD